MHLRAAGVAAVLDGAIQVGPVEHVHADAAARSRQLTHLPDQAVHSILHNMGALKLVFLLFTLALFCLSNKLATGRAFQLLFPFKCASCHSSNLHAETADMSHHADDIPVPSWHDSHPGVTLRPACVLLQLCINACCCPYSDNCNLLHQQPSVRGG